MEINLAHKTLASLASENYQFASVLHSFGIAFYQTPEATLQGTCQQRKLDLQKVIERLLAVNTAQEMPDFAIMKKASLQNLIHYLKQTHRTFIRSRLPYMAKLIADIRPEYFDAPEIAQDLKIIFPLFAEDFIHHIHEEEDTTFEYIQQLVAADTELHFDIAKLFFSMRGYSLADVSESHACEDDEMLGIRQLTHQYAISESTGVYTRVVYSELKAFEAVLQEHSRIENEILFPKALSLEQKLKLKVVARAKLN